MNWVRVALCFLIILFITGVFAGNKPPKMQRPPPSPPPPPRPPGRIGTELWCVAKSGVSSKRCKEFINYACRALGLDCSAIASGRDCNFRKDYKKQASYVLNLYFVKHHACLFEYGTYAHINPSSGRCRFPSVNLNH